MLLLGFLLCLISLLAFTLPSSVIQYDGAIAAGEPLLITYGGTAGFILLGAGMAAAILTYLAALAVAYRSPRARLPLLLGVSFLLCGLFVLVFPSASNDVFKNLADTRTLWVYGDVPLLVAPSAHPDDPVTKALTFYVGSPGPFGPLYYVLNGPAILLAGDGVIEGVTALKALNALFLLLTAALTAAAAGTFASGRPLASFVAVAWNPFLLFEAVGNGHNDVIMVAFSLAALIFFVRASLTRAWLLLLCAVLVKYVTVALLPLLLLRSLSGREKPWLVVLVPAGTAVLIVYLLVFGFPPLVDNILLSGPAYRSPIAALDALGGAVSIPLDWVRFPVIGAMAAFGLAVLFMQRRKDPASTFSTAFWLLLPVPLIVLARFWPWHMTWFIPFGLVLIGRREGNIAVVASCLGLLSYLFFPWVEKSSTFDVYFVGTFMILPAALLFVGERLRLLPGGSPRETATSRARNE